MKNGNVYDEDNKKVFDKITDIVVKLGKRQNENTIFSDHEYEDDKEALKEYCDFDMVEHENKAGLPINTIVMRGWGGNIIDPSIVHVFLEPDGTIIYRHDSLGPIFQGRNEEDLCDTMTRFTEIKLDGSLISIHTKEYSGRFDRWDVNLSKLIDDNTFDKFYSKGLKAISYRKVYQDDEDGYDVFSSYMNDKYSMHERKNVYDDKELADELRNLQEELKTFRFTGINDKVVPCKFDTESKIKALRMMAVKSLY